MPLTLIDEQKKRAYFKKNRSKHALLVLRMILLGKSVSVLCHLFNRSTPLNKIVLKSFVKCFIFLLLLKINY